MNNCSLVLFCLAAISLSGCGDDTEDIKVYMEQVQATTKQYIKPMPEVTPFVHVAYSAADKRSPFILPIAQVIQQRVQKVSGCLSPDNTRRKQPLEKYALSNLTMRGTLGDDSQLWALLEASDLTLHRVSVGNFLGLYHGKITKVSETKVTVIELSPDGSGCWVEREAELKIIKSEPNK